MFLLHSFLFSCLLGEFNFQQVFFHMCFLDDIGQSPPERKKSKPGSHGPLATAIITTLTRTGITTGGALFKQNHDCESVLESGSADVNQVNTTTMEKHKTSDWVYGEYGKLRWNNVWDILIAISDNFMNISYSFCIIFSIENIFWEMKILTTNVLTILMVFDIFHEILTDNYSVIIFALFILSIETLTTKDKHLCIFICDDVVLPFNICDCIDERASNTIEIDSIYVCLGGWQYSLHIILIIITIIVTISIIFVSWKALPHSPLAKHKRKKLKTVEITISGDTFFANNIDCANEYASQTIEIAVKKRKYFDMNEQSREQFDFGYLLDVNINVSNRIDKINTGM